MALELSAAGGAEIAGAAGVVLTLLGGSESVESVELSAAVAAELLVEVVSACFKLVAVEVVPVGVVSLEEVEGTGMSVGIGMAERVMVEAETEFMQSVDVGLVAVVMEEEGVELGGGRAAENRVEEVITGASGETAAVMVSLESDVVDVVSGTDEIELTQLVVVTGVESSLAAVTELVVVVDKPDGVSDMLVEGEEAVAMTEIAASPPAAGEASTERIPFGSGKVDLVDRFVDVVETELSLLGAETVSKVVMEVTVVELEVTEGLGVMDSEEVEVTETVAGGSVGVVVLGRVAWKVEVGSSVVVALASGTEVLLSGSVTFVSVVAAAVVLTESVHISVSDGVTVLEGEIVKLAESGTEFEIVGTVGVVVAVEAGAA